MGSRGVAGNFDSTWLGLTISLASRLRLLAMTESILHGAIGDTGTPPLEMISGAGHDAVVPRAPRFVQYLAKLTSRSRSELAGPGVQRLVYMLRGEVEIAGRRIGIDGFAWVDGWIA